MAAMFGKIGKIIVAGLTYAARTTALHEAMPWDDETRRPRANPPSRE